LSARAHSPDASAHVAWLDSVRGLAALSVIGSHYALSYDLPCASVACDRLLTYTPLRFWWDGSAAVSMFFVLSGMVLSLKHFRRDAKPELSQFSLSEFCVVRFFRIWPPYAAALALNFWLYRLYQEIAPRFPVTTPPRNDWIPYLWEKHRVGWPDALRESFLFDLPEPVVYLPHAWTLSIELTLSLLMPLGLSLAARGMGWLAFFALLALYPLGAPPFLAHFALGLFLAARRETLAAWLRSRAKTRRAALALGIFLYTAGDAFDGKLGENAIWLLSGLGAGLLLLYALASERTQRVLSFAWPRYIGKISYSLYLLHLGVLILATPWLLAPADISPGLFPLAWWAGLASVIALSLACAALFHRLVETPSMALGKRLGGWLRGDSRFDVCSSAFRRRFSK
jgi:peptidoglycan/LPS O-acetylase OafA/YrhL